MTRHNRPTIDWDARLEAARVLASPCRLCAIECGVDRLGGERGRCGLADVTPIYARMLHFGEEHHLIPSYIVSLSGCSMHCTFCSEDKHLRAPFSGAVFSAEALASALKEAITTQRPRARNINFVGGEPSISLPFLLETAKALAEQWPEHPPLLLNSNGYLTSDALALCEGVFEIFVFDLKFGSDDCGWRIGKVKGYQEVVLSALRGAAAFTPAPDIVVRHLLMPGHVDCCTLPVLEWFAEHFSEHATLNVMPGFVPFKGTRAEKLWTPSSSEETKQILRVIEGMKLPSVLWDGLPMRLNTPSGTAHA